MKKCAFYLNARTFEGKDFSQILRGNPGIGGSEYEILLVSYLLETRDNSIEPWLLVNFNGKFPHKYVAFVSDLKDCCEFCVKNNIETLVVDAKYFDDSVLNLYNGKLGVILWAHNDPKQRYLDVCQQREYLKRIVYCGREQMDLFRDHIATQKSTYIYNIFPVQDRVYYRNKRAKGDNHNVVYVGNLVPFKGFHVLAKAWKRIVEQVPDAQLFVIGSGRLYDKNAKLGDYNIASPEYEQMFMPYLTDENNQILSSVHFLGVLGEEKNDVMGKCKVGVPNPTAETETFCICGIEMQLMGCNIVTKHHQAYLDTIKNKQWLYKRESQLADYVVRRLLAPSDNHEELYDYVASKFGPGGNIERWEDVLRHPDENTILPHSSISYQCKWLKDMLRKAKVACPFLNRLPLLKRIYFRIDKIITT